MSSLPPITALPYWHFGPATVLGTGWLIDKLYAKGRKDAAMIVMIVGTIVLVPTGIVFPLMETAEVAFAIYCVNLIGIASVTCASPTALLNVTPGEIRSQATAVYYMAISITGLLLGPSGVGVYHGYHLCGRIDDRLFDRLGRGRSSALPLLIVPAVFTKRLPPRVRGHCGI